jgi:hypothetical protein
LDLSEAWRAHVEDSISYFLAALSPQVREKLDYSPESLDHVGAWLLERYPSLESTFDDPDSKLLGGATFYVGETYCKNIGDFCFWTVHLAELEPDYEYGEFAVIEGFLVDDEQAEVCPGFLVLDAVQDRIETSLSQHLRALIKLLNPRASQIE